MPWRDMNMIIMETEVEVEGLSGVDVTDFLLNPTDENYRKWWDGTHIEFHILKSYPGHIGDIVYMDEFIGRHRIRMKGVVENVVPGELIIWQLKKIVKLPLRLLLKLENNENGVKITHAIKVGFKGVGKILDPIITFFIPGDFIEAMDEHAKTEFQKLRDLLH
jgi:hypothetical protein